MADGLPRECAVNLDHVQTVSRGRLGGLIATLPSQRMIEVWNALLFALGGFVMKGGVVFRDELTRR
jgi:mRNA interferase MazF